MNWIQNTIKLVGTTLVFLWSLAIASALVITMLRWIVWAWSGVLW